MKKAVFNVSSGYIAFTGKIKNTSKFKTKNDEREVVLLCRATVPLGYYCA